MEQLERAILLALDPLADASLREEATEFCNQFKEYSLCISMFQQGSPQVKFFCLSVLESVLKQSYSIILDKSQFRKSVWQWLLLHLANPLPSFLKNKLFYLIVLLFQHQYPKEWDFFTDLLGILSADPVALDAFTKICLYIDEQIVDTHIQRSDQEVAANTIIKDTMRDDSVQRLVEAWQSLLCTYYQSNSKISNRCLKLLSLYVSWVDVNLIVIPSFLSCLQGCFLIPESCIAACDCLSEIACKGMKVVDKLNLLQILNLAGVIGIIDDSSPEVCESVAKTLNIFGVQACSCFDDSKDDVEKSKCVDYIRSLFPHLLKYLANEYDDTTSALFPFLSSFLSVMKRLKRFGSMPMSSDDLIKLLQVLVLKSKFDATEAYLHGSASDENEAFFLDFRKNLRVHMDSIATLDDELFSNAICSLVCNGLEKSTFAAPEFGWTDAELSIYLVYIFSECKTYKGNILYIVEDKPTHIGIIMSKLMQSGISNYPHESIPLIYFEVLVRYSQFFETAREYIPEALGSFLDNRGLHHTQKSDIISISPRKPQVSSDPFPPFSSYFDSQRYIFESIGYLITLDGVSLIIREKYLNALMIPIIRRIEEIMSVADSSLDIILIWELADLITCIGSLGKGFPDYDETKDSQQASWAFLMKSTLQGVLIVLSKLNVHPSIREASRFALQRMIGCLGPALLELLPSFLASGMLSSESAKELTDFLPFLGLMSHKFGNTITNVFSELWTPLRAKIDSFLSEVVKGTDDSVSRSNLQKADLTLLVTLFNCDLDSVLTCANNLPGLNNLLISLLQILQRSDQPSELKLVISLFTKMVYCWGGDGQVHANVQVPFRPINKKKMQKEFKKSPLNGFNEFIYAHILPESFRLPLGPRIALEKGQSQSILNEIAALHKSALSSLGSEYLGYLKDYLTSISCPETTTVQFISTLQDEKQDFKKYLKVSFFYLDVFSNCTELTIAHLSLTF